MSESLELDLWRRAETLFEAALDYSESERAEFLQRACGGDAVLRETVEALLQRDQQDSQFLEVPASQPRVFDLDMDLLSRWVGRELGHYRLLRPLGVGGMSYVFLGERIDDEIEQQVAVKIIREEAQGGAWLRALRRERQILARLDHPNIARSLDGGSTEEGMPFVVLEYVDGMAVTDYCDTAQLSVPQRLELFRKICRAVDYAHRHLVVHRDLKPSNILVTDDGEPKLLDFGIAKLLDSGPLGSAEATATQDRFLTPNYASPEQLAGEPVSMASDVYSLGVLLYEILTGVPARDLTHRPATEPDGPGQPRRIVRPSQAVVAEDAKESDFDLQELSQRRATARGMVPRQLQQQLRGDLDSIVGQCLRWSAEERYRSVGELERDLQRHLQGLPVAARPPKLSYRLRKFVRRHRVGVALGSLAVVGLISLGLGTVLQSQQVARQRDRAEESKAEAEEVTRFLTEAFLLADPFSNPESDLPTGGEATVNQVLDYSADKIRNKFADQPRLQARLMYTIANVFGQAGRFEESEALHQDALSIRRQVASDRPLELIDSLNGLGFIYNDTNRLDEAAPLLKEALELARQVPEEGRSQLADSLTNNAMLLFMQSDLDPAEELFREALAWRAGYLAEDHPEIVVSRLYLARLLNYKGNYEESEVLLRQALESCVRDQGEDHVRTAHILGELAWLLTQQGKYEDAEPHFVRSLEVLEEQFGAEHYKAIGTAANLGLFYREKGDYAEAERILLSVLEIRRRVDGDQLDEQTNVLNNLGLVYLDQQRPQTAEPYFRQALEIARESTGASHHGRHTYMRHLGTSLFDQGNPQAAKPLLRDSLELLRQEYGEDGTSFANGLIALASVLVALGDFEEARDISGQAEQIYSAALPPEHPRIAMARATRGAALAGMERFETAEPLLLESLQWLESSSANKPRRLRVVRSYLIQLYDASGRPEAAERYRQPAN